MSEFKGTNGTWFFEEEPKNWFDILDDRRRNVLRSTNLRKELRANALLISKAPELLEMLNRVRLGEFPYEEIKELIKEATEL